MSILLRDYQKEAVAEALQAFRGGITNQLQVLPTGSGKTIIMASLAKSFGKRTLFLAHREELIAQGLEKFKLIWPEVDAGICKAERNQPDKFVVFGSVQSCFRDSRLEQLKKNNFELLLIDEAHHSSASSYQKIIQELGFSNTDKKKLLMGFTATPLRSDTKELGNTFKEITYNISIGSMIRAGYLSPVVGRRILTQTSLAKVQTRDGDFALGELSEVINTPNRNNFIVEAFCKYAANRKAIAFCCDVQHCKDLASAFRAAQITAKAIYGDMCPEERKTALQELKKGEIQIATSCGVLTEGFDEPSIDCILMTRPTKFKGRFIQCIGRGLRVFPSKNNCLVLDFADEGHNLSAIASLAETFPEAERFGEPVEHTKEQEVKEHSIYIRRVCDEEFDILGATRLIWTQIGDGEWSLAGDAGEDEIVMSPTAEGNGYTAIVYRKNMEEKLLVEDPLSLEYCLGYCEDFARSNFKLNFASTEGTCLSSEEPATERQNAFLRKRGFTKKMTKAQAFMQIKETIAKRRKYYRLSGKMPITNKQAYFLRNRKVNTQGMSKLEATKTISKIMREKIMR